MHPIFERLKERVQVDGGSGSSFDLREREVQSQIPTSWTLSVKSPHPGHSTGASPTASDCQASAESDMTSTGPRQVGQRCRDASTLTETRSEHLRQIASSIRAERSIMPTPIASVLDVKPHRHPAFTRVPILLSNYDLAFSPPC